MCSSPDLSVESRLMNLLDLDLEIRKRYAQPLAIESGEFPDIGMISGRMMPFCYEAGLVSGHAADAPQLLSIATDTFIKEVLTQVFSRTRSNGPGEVGSAGFSIGTNWVQTYRYGKQLHEEEELAQHGKLTRDKNGLLPIESKTASERGPLSMADVRLSLEIADTGMSTFPILLAGILNGYREGELENWSDYTWVHDEEPSKEADEIFSTEVNGGEAFELVNGSSDPMDVDTEPWWDGAEVQDMDMMDTLLDSCLAVNS